MRDEPTPSFAGLKTCAPDALRGASVAVLGAPEASPYDASRPSHSAAAPAAIRRASRQFAAQLHQHDFDLDAVFLDEGDGTGDPVDCGDVATDRHDPEGNRRRIAASVRQVLDAGAVPLLLGGDDSVPIPMIRAYEGRGPLTVVQVDAHVDWGDVIRDNPDGYGSTMRRAADCPWVRSMVQVGIRGLGSGTADQHEDARRWGSRIVTMREIRKHGLDPVIEMVPQGQDCLIAIDLDGMDPVGMPAVAMPTPGGLDYADLLDLMRGIAGRARIAGCAIVEFVPDRDPHGLGALVAARLACSAIGLIRSSLR